MSRHQSLFKWYVIKRFSQGRFAPETPLFWCANRSAAWPRGLPAAKQAIQICGRSIAQKNSQPDLCQVGEPLHIVSIASYITPSLPSPTLFGRWYNPFYRWWWLPCCEHCNILTTEIIVPDNEDVPTLGYSKLAMRFMIMINLEISTSQCNPQYRYHHWQVTYANLFVVVRSHICARASSTEDSFCDNPSIGDDSDDFPVWTLHPDIEETHTSGHFTVAMRFMIEINLETPSLKTTSNTAKTIHRLILETSSCN